MSVLNDTTTLVTSSFRDRTFPALVNKAKMINTVASHRQMSCYLVCTVCSALGDYFSGTSFLGSPTPKCSELSGIKNSAGEIWIQIIPQ